MRIVFLFSLLGYSVVGQNYTEFFCIAGSGGNTNSGHTADATPTYANQGGFWTNATATWQKAGATLTSVTQYSWAAIYSDGYQIPAFIGLVTNANPSSDGFVRLSQVAKAGSNPADNITVAGATSICVGGAWLGPGNYVSGSGYLQTNTFPLSFVNGTMTNQNLDEPCINIKGTFNGGNYGITNLITVANTAGYPLRISGYGSTVRDQSPAYIYGTNAGTAYGLLACSTADVEFTDIVIATNGGASSANMVLINGAGIVVRRLIIHDSRGNGINAGGAGVLVDECEFYANDKANTITLAGLNSGSSGGNVRIRNCVFRANYNGGIGGGTYINCVFYANNNDGFIINVLPAIFYNCDFYANLASGINVKSASLSGGVEVRNCNFFGNSTWGIAYAGAVLRTPGFIVNNYFGAGTKANSSGNLQTPIPTIMVVSNSFDYAANDTPWTDPDNGNFTIKSGAAVKSTGRSYFMQSTTTPVNITKAYPDIGAAQSASTNVAGGSWTFTQ